MAAQDANGCTFVPVTKRKWRRRVLNCSLLRPEERIALLILTHSPLGRDGTYACNEEEIQFRANVPRASVKDALQLGKHLLFLRAAGEPVRLYRDTSSPHGDRKRLGRRYFLSLPSQPEHAGFNFQWRRTGEIACGCISAVLPERRADA